MKPLSIFLSLAAALVVAFGSASQATAAPVPDITQTPQYKALLGFVNTLETQRNVPTTQPRKAAYQRTLGNKTAPATAQVKSLFQRRAMRVKSRDDAEERSQIRNILSNQKQQVTALKAVQASKIAVAQNIYNESVDRINERYAPRLNPLVRQRTSLKRQLARTTNPVSRLQIQESIRSVQARINGIMDAKTAATKVASTDYQSKVNLLNQTYSAKIMGVKSRSQQLVAQARLAWKETYSADYNKLKVRRTSEFSQVSRLRSRGAGYISTMPVPPRPV
jgi:hypothetical protein